MTQVAIITGASAGIGAATAERFVQSGFHTINLSRRKSPVAGVENLCGDLSKPATAQALADDVATELRRLNPNHICLIHNAAVMYKDDALHCPEDHMQQSLQLNVAAVNSLNTRILPLMRAGSSVLYVGSTLSEKAVAGTFSYVVTKHAQLGMMRATCQDLMGKGIHTAMICPGFTDTEMLRQHLNHDESIVAAISQMNAFHRLAKPEEIAEMLFWAHNNPVINGTVMHGNLGQKES